MGRRSTEGAEEPLIVDRAAAAEIPSADAVREWGHGKRAFISSVMSELPPERQAAATAVRTANVLPIMFEQFGGRDADPENAYLGEVETSDIYCAATIRSAARVASPGVLLGENRCLT
jgi:hypothetical protein